MPPSRFNRTAWPEASPHRELLEFLDAVHRRFGCRSLREVGRSMHLSYSRVHDIVRGTSLPVSSDQIRSLVAALVGTRDGEAEAIAAQAVELFVKARRARDEEGASAVLLEPAVDDGPAPGPVSAPGPVPRSRLRLVLAGLAALAVVVAAVTGTVLVTTTSSAEQRTGAIVLQDSFGGTDLDPQRWLPATRADLIHPRDGGLHFVIGPADSAEGAEARLEPRSLDGFRQVSFVVATSRATTQGPGGASMTLRLSDGKTHRLVWGPGTQGSLVAALVCSREDCDQYDDYDPPGSYTLMRPGNGTTDAGERIPVRIVQADDGTVQFFVRGNLVAQGPPGDAPLETFSWDLYGADSEAWDLTVTSLIVSD